MTTVGVKTLTKVIRKLKDRICGCVQRVLVLLSLAAASSSTAVPLLPSKVNWSRSAMQVRLAGRPNGLITGSRVLAQAVLSVA